MLQNVVLVSVMHQHVPAMCVTQLAVCDSLPWTVAHQASLSMGFSRQEYWIQLPCTSPGDLPNPGIKRGSPTLPADSLPSEPPGNRLKHVPSLLNFPPFQPVTEYWVETPASCSKFPLAICSKHGKAYVSILLSQLVQPSPTGSASLFCASLLLLVLFEQADDSRSVLKFGR